MKINDCIYVEWVDSHKTGGWCVGHNISIAPVSISSIGWLIAQSESALVLTAHKSINEETPQYCNAMTIPKKAIVKSKVIRI